MGIPILGDLIDELGKTVRQVLPNNEARLSFDAKLAEFADRAQQRFHEQLQGQVEINKIEASHRSIFVAGWRPYVGWGCGSALIYSTLLSPLIEFVARLCGWTGAMPVIDTAFLQTILLAMLGVAGMRTYEKVKGVSSDAPVGKPVVETATTVTTSAEPAKPKRKRFRIKLAIAALLAASLAAMPGLESAARAAPQAPAIVAAEQQLAAACRETREALAARIARGDRPDRAEAFELAKKAMVALTRLEVGRIAYDLTVAERASPATRKLVAASRVRTDRDCNELGLLLDRSINPLTEPPLTLPR